MVFTNPDQPVVNFVAMERVPQLVEHADCFSINTSRKHLWLQKACIWVLRKLGCNHFSTHETIRYYKMDVKSVVRAISAQYGHLMQHYDHKPTIIYMGKDQYEEFISGPEVRGRMSFDNSLNGMFPFQYNGMKIVLVTWMDGVILV